MSGFYWLASYPKSGNTWLRLSLLSLSRGGAPPDFTDETTFAPLASSAKAFEDRLDVEPNDLSADEVTALRPRLYEIEARDATEPLLRKVHDAFTHTIRGEPMFPQAVTLGTIYIARDPRDVAVSLAHHMQWSVDVVIAMLNDPGATFSRRSSRGERQLPQRALTWSEHVKSWLDAPGPPPVLVRYEDMLSEPVGSLESVARYLRWDPAPDAVIRATKATRFDALKSEEERHGFPEAPVNVKFFRRGVAGDWRDTLTAVQAAKIEREHGEVMARLGYS